MFSCEYCEIFNNSFFYRTPPVAASKKSYLLTFAHSIFFLPIPLMTLALVGAAGKSEESLKSWIKINN